MGRIDRKTLEEQLPAILREQFNKDGLPRDHLPSWNYITANTRFSAEGLNIKCQKFYDQTLHEHLREQGFGALANDDWPTEDEETIASLNYYKKSLKENRGFEKTTINGVESAINKAYEAINEEDLDIELLDIGSYDLDSERVENIQNAKSIINYMDEQLADGTMNNYPHYISLYYDVIKNNWPVNINPIENALDEYDWSRSQSDPEPLTKAQLRDLWNTLDALDECPVEGYELNQWRLWMKMLIVFIVSVGPRSNEIEKIDVKDQLHFGDDPHVHFEERKNLNKGQGREKVPMMIGSKFLESYIDYIEIVGGNDKLIPSSESASGSRTQQTLNNWLQRLCKKAGVRLENGDFPTIQNVRQLWQTHYKKAVHENWEQVEIVAAEAGTKNSKVVERNYLDDQVVRKHIRELGRKYFDDLLDIDEVPQLVQNKLDQNEYIGRQSRFADYADDI